MPDNTEERSLTPTVNDWIYAASALDCEGCITVYRTKNYNRVGKKYYVYGPAVIVGNTNRILTDWFYFTFGGLRQLRIKKSGKWKNCHLWTIHRSDVIRWVLNGVSPYLKMKNRQASFLLEYVSHKNENNPAYREQVYQALKVLNKRGKSVETITLGAIGSSIVKIESDLVGDCEKLAEMTSSA